MDKQLLIMGTTPFATVFADVFDSVDGFRVSGFIENLDKARAEARLLDLPIHWIDELDDGGGCRWAICCLATPRRDSFVRQVAERGVPFATLAHPTATVSARSTLGEGASLDVGVIVAAYSSIGRHVRIGRGATIGHHLRIHDFATLMPGVNIASETEIGPGATVGMGATVIEGRRVGAGSVVGAGAVVTADVPDRCLAAGVPARVVKSDLEPR
jgi:sugar O-acyltransferase (sialic acid O-acetyltransferase NeuD family)